MEILSQPQSNTLGRRTGYDGLPGKRFSTCTRPTRKSHTNSSFCDDFGTSSNSHAHARTGSWMFVAPAPLCPQKLSALRIGGREVPVYSLGDGHIAERPCSKGMQAFGGGLPPSWPLAGMCRGLVGLRGRSAQTLNAPSLPLSSPRSAVGRVRHDGGDSDTGGPTFQLSALGMGAGYVRIGGAVLSRFTPPLAGMCCAFAVHGRNAKRSALPLSWGIQFRGISLVVRGGSRRGL